MSVRFSGFFLQVGQIVKRQLDRHPWLLLLLFIAVSFSVFAAYSFDRYQSFQTNFFDLGLDANSIWRTLNGYDSLSSLILPSTLGHIGHISPVLGLVALAYAAFPDPRTLLVIQSAAVSAATAPLYMIAMRETRSRFLSLTVAGLYLLNPALHGIVRYDFHAESFIPLSVFLVYYFYPTRSSGLFYLSLAFMFSTIEYSGVIGLGMSLSLWLVKKRLDTRIMTTLAASTALLAVILLSTVGRAFQAWGWTPNWLAGQFFGVGTAQASSYFGWLNAFETNPLTLLTALEYNLSAKVTYLILVTAPMWFAALRYSSKIIPAVPWIIVVLLVPRYSYSSIDFQYSAFIVPFVYLASIPFLYRILRARKLIFSMCAVALCAMLLYSALSPIGPHGSWAQPSPLLATVGSIDRTLPQDATILTQSDLFPQLSDKAHVTINYSSPEPPQYIVVNVESSWYNWTNPGLGYTVSAREQFQHLTTSYDYQLMVAYQGLRLYQLQNPNVVPCTGRLPNIRMNGEEAKIALLGNLGWTLLIQP